MLLQVLANNIARNVLLQYITIDHIESLEENAFYEILDNVKTDSGRLQQNLVYMADIKKELILNSR
jgi:hypothetical protein